MKSPYAMFETDADLEAGKGVEIDFGGFSITVHRAGGANRKYASILAAKMQPMRRQAQNGTMDDATATRILAEAFAEGVIVGWKNMTGRDGKTLKFTRENCVQLLIDLPDLFREVQEHASNIANFRKAATEADAKNSPRS